LTSAKNFGNLQRKLGHKEKLLDFHRTGQRGETTVASLLRSAGYEVHRAYKSLGTFDLIARRGKTLLAVQIKASKSTKTKGKPYKEYEMLMRSDYPQSCRRIWWDVLIGGDATHTLYEALPNFKIEKIELRSVL